MITVAAAVEKIVTEDGFVREAMQRGILNISAYADTIHSRIEEDTFKPVARGTIIVALTRLQKKIGTSPPLTPQIALESIGVQTNISDITFEKTQEVLQKLQTLKMKLMLN